MLCLSLGLLTVESLIIARRCWQWTLDSRTICWWSLRLIIAEPLIMKSVTLWWMVLWFGEQPNLTNLQCGGFWCSKLQNLLRHQYLSIYLFLKWPQISRDIEVWCTLWHIAMYVLQVLQTFDSHYTDTQHMTLATHFGCWEFYSCCHWLSVVAFVLFLFWTSGKLAW